MSAKNSPRNDYVEQPEPNQSASPPWLRCMSIPNETFRQMLAEVAGTFILVVFGLGVLAQGYAYGTMTSWLQISICWGLALTMGVYYSGGVSGGHLNPAITLTMATFGRLDWKKVPSYIVGQFLGAFLAAFVVYICYSPCFKDYNQSTAGIFATYPDSRMSLCSAFLNELVATAFLVGGIFAITDNMNHGASHGAKPLAIGGVIAAIAMAFGANTGFALNPARDLAPRIFTALAPWGMSVFSFSHNYFWVPIVAPCIGALCGGFLYTFMVEVHHPTRYPLTRGQDKTDYGSF